MAGLGFAVKLRGNLPFLGRDALEAAARRGRCRGCSPGFAVADPEVVLLGRETIFRDGRRVGWLASGGWGYTLGRSLGYGYVRDPENGVDGGGRAVGDLRARGRHGRVPAEAFLRLPYDPDGTRIRS